ncbi:MAG TPA: beta-lactamase family protein [Candidatus Eisenbergiella merdipullorum]|uniref:Beta-lactamase family protein n=1 Tax=Candidatus Eisenbergiella merdipullorum TaxID=2838553 RepID=A0A9D2L0G1_9FIRM|nr:beta-lactamase family protein [Candidatus Eisenbergiella merdipullorum]
MDIREIDQYAEEMRILNLRVCRDGEVIVKKDWDEEMRRNQYSASKSFTSAAVGIACREGLLDLDEKLCDAFVEEIPAQPSENLQKAAVRDLLTMCLGQKEAWLMGGQRPSMKEKDWVRFCLSRPFEAEPGTEFVYNNAGPYLAGILVQRRAGCDLVDYLMPRLFEPLGIRRTVWEVDPCGLTFGAGGLFLCVTELMKFGQLLLQEGSWNGKQLIPAEYIREASRVHADNGAEGYGYLFWRGAYNSYRADGKYGQLAIVLPDKNAVIAVNAESRDAGSMMKRCMDVIVPQL